MANEFIHKDVGGGMTEAEYDAVGAHVFESQATGDILYASSATQLSRLAKGVANTVLVMGASIPAWSATLAGLTLTSPTINGTITTTGLTLPAITLGGTVTINGQILDAGSGNLEITVTANDRGLNIVNTGDGIGGVYITLKHHSPTPANGDRTGYFGFWGYNNAGTPESLGYGYFLNYMVSVVDGAEDSRFEWWLYNAGVLNNPCMRLSGAGLLELDSAGSGAGAPSLFDEYDDALVIRQGIQQNNREMLTDIGVMERKDTGSGYMLKIQPMLNLLAGGIYQTRGRIDDLIDVLVSEFPQVTERLIERKLIGG